MYGASDRCFETLANPKGPCDKNRPEECVGHLHANYVYKLEVGKWTLEVIF